MSYQKDRDQFVGQIVSEVTAAGGTNNQGVALARLILRNASTIQRCETAVCSDEAADRDRVPCPAIKSGRDEDCCCDRYPDGVCSTTPRVQVAIMRARQRIDAACKPWGIVPNHGGDPRGCCVKMILPSGRWNSWGGAEEGFCVPVR